jgi:hypothetical protein
VTNTPNQCAAANAVKRLRFSKPLCPARLIFVIQQGDFGELLAARFYEQTPLTRKYLVVAYREIGSDDGFIVTAYLARRPSTQRIVLWKR